MKPEEDGITHINVYSQGKTELGRMLSNFAYSPISTVDGKFNSIEGYWYWLGCTHPDKDRLRALYGFAAKQTGRALKAKDWQDDDKFKSKIALAISIKIENNPKLQELFYNSSLPFVHYYNFSGKVVEVKDGQWILEHLEELRKNDRNNN